MSTIYNRIKKNIKGGEGFKDIQGIEVPGGATIYYV